MNLFEAFKALDALNEDTFSVSDDGIVKLDQFQQKDEEADAIDVIDTDAETEEDLQDSYVGKVILDCGVCHSKIYKDKEEVELNDEQTLANVGEECPFCYTSDGFKVIGEVADYSASTEELTDDTDVDTDEGNDNAAETNESLQEGVNKKGYLDPEDEQLQKLAAKLSHLKARPSMFEDRGLCHGAITFRTDSTKIPEEVAEAANSLGLQLGKNFISRRPVKDSEGKIKWYNIKIAIQGDDTVEESLSVSPTKDDIRDDKSESLTDTLAEAVATLERPMLAMGGTLSNVMTAHKDELATIFDRDSAISFLDSIEPEVKNKGYLATIKEKIARIPSSRISQFLYNIILKGDGMGTKMESVNESTNTYTDVDGLVGEKGAKYTEANLKAYWDKEKNNNPFLANYKGNYQAWLKDTTSSMKVENLEEGIFGGNKYKDKNLLVYRGQGRDEVVAIGNRDGSDHNLYYFKEAHMKKNGAKDSDYVSVSPTSQAVKKYKASLKTAEDVTNDLPYWVTKFVKADKEKRHQEYQANERQKELEAQAKRDKYRKKAHNPDDDYIYIKGKETGTYKYRENLGDDDAFSDDYDGIQDVNESKFITESVNNVNVETDDSIVNISSDENSKVTVTTEPIASGGAELTAGDVPAEGTPEGEVLAPIDAETEAEITGEASDEVDVPVDEFDEESFDELGESYLKKVYENVESFKTSSITETKDSKLVVEGIVKFDSGNEKKTSFVFEAKDCTKSGRCRFLGENLNITKGNKAFLMTGKISNGKFISESLKYDYNAGDSRVSGFVKREVI